MIPPVRPVATMATWTPKHNAYMSCLLDDVIGTEKMVKTRQDSCIIWDCFLSSAGTGPAYFVGSKAEGLHLAGSDDDYMYDINSTHDIEASESPQDLFESIHSHKCLIITDKVTPGYVLLKCVSQIQERHLFYSLININDSKYLSSQLFLPSSPHLKPKGDTRRIKGPSVEIWPKYADTSASSADNVFSIRVKHWPSSAAEWIVRPRHYGWPSLKDKQSIVAFGCHLVPIGHLMYPVKSLQWRLSFSIAERRLVWSFNHTQMQCYALMKLILKEFVNAKCSEENKDVLCSYFIKTFLFWQYEATDKIFWQTQNIHKCLAFLLREFYTCIYTGVLRHYFIPQFNLLEIKLTPGAQQELLQLFYFVVQRNLDILAHCQSLSVVWPTFINGRNNNILEIQKVQRRQILDNEHTFMTVLYYQRVKLLKMEKCRRSSLGAALFELENQIISQSVANTFLPQLVMSEICTRITVNKLRSSPRGNKSRYDSIQVLDKNVFGVDIASSKLWLATFQLQREDFCAVLQSINDVLSCIPFNAQYLEGISFVYGFLHAHRDLHFMRDDNIVSRAKKTWLLDLVISQQDFPFVPCALQVELLNNRDPNIEIRVSPFTYAYYLRFLCYHELGQYGSRDRALRQLREAVYDSDRCGLWGHISCNILGHCLLMAGHMVMARDIFLESAHFTCQDEVIDQNNSAYHYLSYLQ